MQQSGEDPLKASECGGLNSLAIWPDFMYPFYTGWVAPAERKLPLEERGQASGLMRWSLAFAFVAKKQLRVENVSLCLLFSKMENPLDLKYQQSDSQCHGLRHTAKHSLDKTFEQILLLCISHSFNGQVIITRGPHGHAGRHGCGVPLHGLWLAVLVCLSLRHCTACKTSISV